METRFSFTEVRLKKITPPLKGRIRLYDTLVPGLCLRVTALGTKTFIVYRKLSSTRKPLTIKLGTFPSTSIKEARKRATRAILDITRGINPNTAVHAARNELSLKGLFDSVLGDEWKTIKDKRNLNSIYRRHLNQWGNRHLSEISRQHIQALHTKIEDSSGGYIANRTVEVLRCLFNYARERGFAGPNPAVGIRQFQEKQRERFINPSEMPKFLSALKEEPNQTFRDFFMVLLLTGVRRANLLAMRWDEINFAERLWHIPETKNGESQTLPLIQQVIDILQRRKNNRSEYVFESTLSKSGHIEEVKSAWKRILARAEIKDLRIHDLRRTFGSYQIAQNSSLQIVGKSLNHKSLQATQVYARLNLDPVRESIEKGTQAMLKAGGLVKQADILEFDQSGARKAGGQKG